jgi:coproporphyrinogen III oxidase
VRSFYATGVSVVAHPRSPIVPIVHLNVRFFELTGRGGRPLDHWFGGGVDMTPTYPLPEDAAFFHRGLKGLCDAHGGGLYEPFKRACDQYFVNRHRSCEPRGIGGLFFDHLRGDGSSSYGSTTLEWEGLLAFVRAVGLCLPGVYGPVVARRMERPYGDSERDFQLKRRARYVEFNLVHDRGTRFGLQTNGRIESVLMSLPPMAAWNYDDGSQPGAPFEAAFMDMLRPRDWTAWTGDVD